MVNPSKTLKLRLAPIVLACFIVLGVSAVLVAQGARSPGSDREETQMTKGRVVDGIRLTDLDDGFKYPVVLDNKVWKQILDPFRYHVLREKGTERAFANALWDEHRSGIYYSAATGQALFSSTDKYDSGTGWPSFTKPISPDVVHYFTDTEIGYTRVEVADSSSGSHLGHVFPDGPAPTGLRYCLNSASLIFVPDGEAAPLIPGLAEALAAAGL